MTDLKDVVIEAHGGLGRWKKLTRVSAHLVCGGGLWPLKGQDGILADVTVLVDLQRQFASHRPFGEPGLRTAFTANRVAVDREDGSVVEERTDPRASFANHVVQTPWDRLDVAYFAGYAMWTYLTAPFSFDRPGFRTRELSPWRENGETWRRLEVEFPEDVATHCRTQVFYFGDDGLLRRHDYEAEVVKAGPAAHYAFDYKDVDGIMVPTRRRVYSLSADGSPDFGQLAVSIDLDEIAFA
ncbi:hypothetical protein [Amycolatopsis sp. SID8362]|uniref:hypothetical protein n=1 Tax=Amycolatopsis sp. SID8362 TaxID=2690346 RepID=UPI00136B4DEE|nr:hypothetical protein [Amycolatopsis sp. SID8362]NBH02568.1 hypothetical protein [Amycolatopsis sp. SID8362]NED39270.1 hypothetical protein [Amycolatopsis sp. SID8362]